MPSIELSIDGCALSIGSLQLTRIPTRHGISLRRGIPSSMLSQPAWSGAPCPSQPAVDYDCGPEKPSTALTAAAVRRCRDHMMRVQARGMWSGVLLVTPSAGNRWHAACGSYGCIRPNEGRVVSSIAAEKKPARWPRIDRNAARHSAWLLAPVAAACPNVSAMIGFERTAAQSVGLARCGSRRGHGTRPMRTARRASQRLRVRNRGGSAHRSSALCQTAWRRRIAHA